MPMTSEAAKRNRHERNLGKYAVGSPVVWRFWRSVDTTIDCWLWTGPFNDDGYGRINVLGRPVRAHRFSWEMQFGPIPVGFSVCHKCDNPKCVRPEHLFLGTAQDNMADMASKGRAPKGDQHWSRKHPSLVARGERQSKLTEAQVLEIRRRAETESYASLGREFGVGHEQIRRIYRRLRWAWL